MSYYTNVRFEFSDPPSSFDDVSKTARSWLEAQECYAVDDIIEDLLRGWTEGETDFNGLISNDVEGLMTSISAHYPTISFYVRGMGEEFEDVWLRQFEGGKIVYSKGPFGQADESSDAGAGVADVD